MKRISIGRREGEIAHLDEVARSTHVHVLGGSGSGKSKLLEHMIQRDIRNDSGVCLIDRHGTLYDSLVTWLGRWGYEGKKKIHLIDTSSTDWSVGFNPLTAGDGASTRRVGAMVRAFLKAWRMEQATDTPRLLKCLHLVFYALAVHRLSIMEAGWLTSLATAEERRRLTETLPNAVYREAWREFNEAYTPKLFAEYFESTISRLTPFMASEVVSRMMGQTENVLDFGRCMDERHIVLVKLSDKGDATDLDLQLLGAMLVSDLFLNAKRRDEQVADRNPFYCYIDECQDYLTTDIARALDQTRKFGLHFTLSHQRLGQLHEYGQGLYDAVMVNAQTKIVFRTDEDANAEALARHLFRKSFDTQRTKPVLDRPVAVGQSRIQLAQGSRSRARTTSTAKARSRGEGASEAFGLTAGEVQSSGTGLFQPEDQALSPGGQYLTTGLSASSVSSQMRGTMVTHGSAEVEGEGWSEAESEGWSEALATDYAIMPTAVYSIEEQIHEAIVGIRSLPKRMAIVYESGAAHPYLMETIEVRPRVLLPTPRAQFLERVNRASVFTRPIEEVDAILAARKAGPGGPEQASVVEDDEDDFRVPDRS